MDNAQEDAQATTRQCPQVPRDTLGETLAWVISQSEEAKDHPEGCGCTGCVLRWWRAPEEELNDGNG